jgi:hypothetical protein
MCLWAHVGAGEWCYFNAIEYLLIIANTNSVLFSLSTILILISLNSKSDFSSNALIIFPVADTYNSIYAGSLSATGFIWYVWHHVIYTRISGTVSLYIDGVLKSTATNTSSLQSNSATTSNSLGSFAGGFYCCRFYNSVMNSRDSESSFC